MKSSPPSFPASLVGGPFPEDFRLLPHPPVKLFLHFLKRAFYDQFFPAEKNRRPGTRLPFRFAALQPYRGYAIEIPQFQLPAHRCSPEKFILEGGMVRQDGSDPLLLKVELDKTSFVTGNRAYDFRQAYEQSFNLPFGFQSRERIGDVQGIGFPHRFRGGKAREIPPLPNAPFAHAPHIGNSRYFDSLI